MQQENIRMLPILSMVLGAGAGVALGKYSHENVLYPRKKPTVHNRLRFEKRRDFLKGFYAETASLVTSASKCLEHDPNEDGLQESYFRIMTYYRPLNSLYFNNTSLKRAINKVINHEESIVKKVRSRTTAKEVRREIDAVVDGCRKITTSLTDVDMLLWI